MLILYQLVRVCVLSVFKNLVNQFSKNKPVNEEIHEPSVDFNLSVDSSSITFIDNYGTLLCPILGLQCSVKQKRSVKHVSVRKVGIWNWNIRIFNVKPNLRSFQYDA